MWLMGIEILVLLELLRQMNLSLGRERMTFGRFCNQPRLFALQVHKRFYCLNNVHIYRIVTMLRFIDHNYKTQQKFEKMISIDSIEASQI